MAAISRVHVAMFGDAAAAGEPLATTDAPPPSRGSPGPNAAAAAKAQEPPPAPLQRMHFSAEAAHTVLAYAGPEFVLYAVSWTTGSSCGPSFEFL